MQAHLEDAAPHDYPCPDLRPDFEAGKMLFLVARDNAGGFVGCVAVRLHDGPEFEIVGMNMSRAPFMMRAVFQQICSQADVMGARISCLIEVEAMEKIAGRFGLQRRAVLCQREPA